MCVDMYVYIYIYIYIHTYIHNYMYIARRHIYPTCPTYRAYHMGAGGGRTEFQDVLLNPRNNNNNDDKSNE